MKTKAEVFVLDDNHDARNILKDILRAKGYEIFVAAKGKTILDRIKDEIPAVALIDLKLEDMSGLEVMREIKKCSPNTECIVLTGHGSHASAIEAVKLGAYSYMQKPYDVEQLVITIRRAIEKRENERTLQESEERYRAIFEQALDSTVLIDAGSGDLIEFNDSAHKNLGYTREEFHKLKIPDIEVIENIEEVKKHIEGVLREGSDIFETKHRTKGGEIRNVIVSTRAISIRERDLLLSIWCDITERKQAEEELRESEEKFRNLIKTLPIGISMSTPEGTVTELNSAILKVFAYDSKEDFLKVPASAHYDNPKDRERFIELHEKGLVKDLELQFKRKDSTVFWGRVTSTKRTTPAGTTQFINVFEDITERKRGEERLRQQFIRMNLLNQITRATVERQDIESIFRVVLQRLEEQLPIDFGCVCFFDPVTDTLIISAIGSKSRSLANRLGMEENTVIPIDENGLRKCVQGQTVYEPDIFRVDLPFPKKLTQAGLRSMVGAPLAVENNVLGVLLAARHSKEAFNSVDCEFLRQLSEHIALAVQNARLYEDLQKAYDQLRETQQVIMEQERLRAMGQMASGIAHDVNNALAPITLYTESLLEGERNLTKRARRYLKTIQTATEDIANTVARMRGFYCKPEEEQIELRPVNLKQLIDQVIDLTRPRWQNIPQEHGVVIDIKKDVPKELPLVLGVESDIRDVITNLIFNAVDAMPKGGTLTMRARVKNLGLIFEVIDTGIGMDEETRLHCLEPFYTQKGERGTGLGLAMVYGMMQRHEGEIEIESKPGKGTTVRLIFPLREAPKAIPVMSPEGITKPSPQHILFIEDDPLVRESLKRTLEMDGHKVQAAGGGQAGLDAFHTAKERGEIFDVVITDLGMPHMDGREVARMVKRESPSTPVILLTGWGTRIKAKDETPSHVDRVLSKPPKISELRQTIMEIVERRPERGIIEDESP